MVEGCGWMDDDGRTDGSGRIVGWTDDGWTGRADGLIRVDDF